MRKIYLLVFLLVTIFMSSEASAWWNEQWPIRRKITLDTTANGGDIQQALSDVPILVRLHTGNFNFALAKENGEDIRFVGADDQTLLKYHIESFDPIEEIGLVWIKVPQLAPSSPQNAVSLYYGNSQAAGGTNPRETYDINQVAVFHFAELEGPPQDVTANEAQIKRFAGGQGLPGVIGYGLTLNGPSDRLVVAASPALDFKAGFTFSAWVRIAAPQQEAYLVSRQAGEDEKGAIIFGIDGTSLFATLTASDGDSTTARAETELSLNTWHQVAVAAAPGSPLTVYLDGAQVNASSTANGIPDLGGDIVIGDAAAGGHALIAEIDELNISNIARPAGWIKALYASQGSEGRLELFGPEETGGGGGLPVFYLATIMKNITLDGWLIIGCLGLLAAFSWVAFLSKAMFLYLTRRENLSFSRTFSASTDEHAIAKEAQRYRNSGFGRIYKIGQQVLERSLADPQLCFKDAAESGNPEPQAGILLNAKGMSAFRAGLERGFIEETQRLNAWLVLLTLAISGGPFLGLLGTVWGVMNTFAAMAEAGEANIMAIAPGVASALSTTVVGLIVAIPALFSYNYLTGKIKDMTANLTIFIDQYTVKVDRVYGSST